MNTQARDTILRTAATEKFQDLSKMTQTAPLIFCTPPLVITMTLFSERGLGSMPGIRGYNLFLISLRTHV